MNDGVATIGGWEKINANLFGVRVGPHVECALFKWLSVDLSGGFSTSVVDSRFEYDDMVTIAGEGSQTDVGSERSCGWVYGGYVRGQVNVRFYKNASVFAGGEFNSLSDFTQSAGAAQARLNLRSAIYLTAGVGWTF